MALLTPTRTSTTRQGAVRHGSALWATVLQIEGRTTILTTPAIPWIECLDLVSAISSILGRPVTRTQATSIAVTSKEAATLLCSTLRRRPRKLRVQAIRTTLTEAGTATTRISAQKAALGTSAPFIIPTIRLMRDMGVGRNIIRAQTRTKTSAVLPASPART